MDIKIRNTSKKRVVVVGGGFAGITVINKLNSDLFQIVLIDKNNYHQFPPLLYQVASSGLEPSSISFPFRKLFHNKKDFYFRMAEVLSISADTHTISTSIGDLEYDYLILGGGATTNFFGNANLEKQALPMKDVSEALTLRSFILLNLEKALAETDPEKRRSLLNFVIVGGGATGVEVAGALAEMKRFVVPKDYPDLKEKVNVHLVEGSNKLLANMSEKASRYARKDLQKMGVSIHLNKLVTDYKDDQLIFNDGKTMTTGTVIWVSGIKANHFNGITDKQTGRGGRILVDEYSRLNGYDNIFVIGDLSLMQQKDYPNGHPQVAQVAIQQGKLVAKNLKNIMKGKPLKAFYYKDLGTMATIGRNKAVADLHGIHLHGFFAWAIWLVIHLRSILGVKNKLFVLINWIWNYISYDQSARFIFTDSYRKEKKNNTL